MNENFMHVQSKIDFLTLFHWTDISILILVFNAAQFCPKMAQLFPEHVIRHYQYLRDSIPGLVPQHIKVRYGIVRD